MQIVVLYSLFLLILSLPNINSQLINCLKPTGCTRDECCFNIMPRTGPVCHRLKDCFLPFDRECCENTRVANTKYGKMYGYALLLDDLYLYRDKGNRFLQIWLGVPYARPPTRGKNLRFMPPEDPDYIDKLDCTKYRAACPQVSKHLKGLADTQTNEDCLFLNIFVTNTTLDQSRHNIYPILVFFHGGEHAYGAAAFTPGHALAQTNIMVVTVQYRLNALGFLSFEQPQALGNYGLLDQVKALMYVKTQIVHYRGDPTQVTLMGHGSGAGDVALHSMSPLSGMWSEPLFHRAVWLSGSDLMWGGFVRNNGEAARFANEMSFRSGCSGAESTDEKLACLRQRTDTEIAAAASQIQVYQRSFIGKPWSPCVDGKFITDFPDDLRKQGKFYHTKVIGGVTWDEGGIFTENITSVWTNHSITDSVFRTEVNKMAHDVFPHDETVIADAIRFEYTHWADQKNNSMRLQMLRDLYSDRYYGSGVIQSLRYNADKRPLKNFTQMYVFKYRSATEPKAQALGAYHGSDLQYIFGLPYFNESKPEEWREIGLEKPEFAYDKLDNNMTDYMLYFISNFVIHGNATPELVRNFTWDTFRWNNRTYFLLNLQDDFRNDFTLKQDFRTFHYAFWNIFFPELILRPVRLSTILPTAAYLVQYQTSTFALTGILVLVVILMAGLLIVLCNRLRTRARTTI